MNEGIPKQFSSPEEELIYLRERIAERERELLSRNPEIDRADTETIGRQEIREYASFTPKVILDREHALDAPALAASRLPAAIKVSALVISVLTLLRVALLRVSLLSATRISFSAVLVVGKFSS